MLFVTVHRPIYKLARVIGGADYGVERFEIARYQEPTLVTSDGRRMPQIKKQLIWWPGHKSWKGTIAGYTYCPGSLAIQAWSDELRRYVNIYPGRALEEQMGTRLSQVLKSPPGRAWIREHFLDAVDNEGVPIVDALGARHTTIIQEGSYGC